LLRPVDIWVLFGPNQFDAVAGAGPGVARHAAHGVKARRIDAEVVNQVFAQMKTDNLAQHNDARAGLAAGVDDLNQLALHLRWRLGNARGTDRFTGPRRQAGKHELVHLRRHFGGGGVCCRGDGIADHVHHKLAGLFHVAQGVFPWVESDPGGRRADHRAKQQCGRVGAHAGEKAEWRKVGQSVAVNGGNQRHRARHNDAGHELVDLARFVVGGVDGEDFVGGWND
jgi:hypothetical protein